MFRNLHLKLFSLLLAMIFWVFVVSIENTFYQFPGEVAIQVFNQAADLAFASPLGSVKLIIRTTNSVSLRSLSPNDFEAYVDLRNVAAGKRKVPVLVTAKNPAVSVVRIEPSEIEVILSPVREKVISLKTTQRGQPSRGFRVQGIKLSQQTVKISGAESLLKKISNVKAEIMLEGTEDANVSKQITPKIYDASGGELKGLDINPETLEVMLTIVESEISKSLGIRPRFSGALLSGVVKKIVTNPGVTVVTGSRETLEKLDVLETEVIDLKGIEESFEKTVKLILPTGISLGEGEKGEVRVGVEVEGK